MSAAPFCIVPAAGASSRMGAHKLLLPVESAVGFECAMVEASVATALAAGCGVILVVGRDADAVAALFALEKRVRIVRNTDWELGMVGSIQAGVSALLSKTAQQTDGFFVHHADMPFVDAEVFGMLCGVAQARAAAGRAPVPLYASFGGKTGHPVYIPSGLIPGILGLYKSGAMKPFLDAAGGLPVETGCAGVLVDIDTPEEYARGRNAGK